MRHAAVWLALVTVLWRCAAVAQAGETPSNSGPDQADPRAEDESPAAEEWSLRNPCHEAWRCPDPMALGSAPVPADEHILPPGARRLPPRASGPKYRRMRTVDGRWLWVRILRPVRMARGFTPPPGSAPWQVQLQRPERLMAVTQRALDWEDRMACGGALIARGWAVTAAHCVTDYGANVKDAGYRIRLGVSDISNGQQGISYRITEVHVAPGYDGTTYLNDLALIRFEPDAQTATARRAWVQSIVVDPQPPATRNRPGQQAFFYGWGQTERDHPSAPLQIGVVALQPAAACPHSAIALCGKGLGSAGAAQCHGDSGGPLVVFDDRVPTLIGIVSHNQGLAKCGENPAPGVFTRIAPFRGWIEGLTGKLAVPIERGESRAP